MCRSTVTTMRMIMRMIMRMMMMMLRTGIEQCALLKTKLKKLSFRKNVPPRSSSIKHVAVVASELIRRGGIQ